jgi:hypothetical protein
MEASLQVHEAPDLGAVDPDVRLDVGRRPPDGDQVDAEQLGASLQRRGDRPGIGLVVRFPSPHEGTLDEHMFESKGRRTPALHQPTVKRPRPW